MLNVARLCQIGWIAKMVKTTKKLGSSADSKAPGLAPAGAARDVEGALKILEGKDKTRIIFHLLAEPVLQLAQLERVIPAASQKLLIQQLRELERDGLVRRAGDSEVPAAVEYALTGAGRALRPALLQLREWAALRRVEI